MPDSSLQHIQRSVLKLLLPLNSQELFKTCVEEGMSLSGAENASLFLEKNENFVRVYSTVPLKDRMKPHPRGNMYKAFKQGKIKLISMLSVQKTHPEATDQFQSMILIPLSYQKKRLGVLSLHSSEKFEFNAQLKQILEIFGSISALAIRNIQLYEDAQAAIEARDLFMSAAAHELKTPLTTIQAYSQLAKKKIQQESPVKAIWIESILSSSRKLHILITELFSMTQMKMGVFRYSFARTGLSELIAKVVADNKILYKRSIYFINKLGKDSAFIEADATKLELVFQNVIGNAIKYSKPTTPIRIVLKEKDDHYLTTITDKGRGMDKQDLEHIFDPFYRGKRNKSSGLGLGMHLCKEIIEAHHGEIIVTSKPKEGTKVSIYLPLESND
jgi:K+-sensing histidine kinase KdpD